MIRVGLTALAILGLSACTEQTPQEAPSTEPAERVDTAPVAAETTETLEIVSALDAGYPMLVLTGRRADGAEIELLLNAEEAELNGAEPAALAGQSVSLTYSTRLEPLLASVRAGDTEVFGEPTAPPPADSATITGVLSGAEGPTQGDLPDMITISPEAGDALAFEAFITPELAAANGQTVTAAYVEASVNRVLAVQTPP